MRYRNFAGTLEAESKRVHVNTVHEQKESRFFLLPREVASQYAPKDIFNADETRLRDLLRDRTTAFKGSSVRVERGVNE